MKNYFYVSLFLATVCSFQLQGMNKENSRKSFEEEQNTIRKIEKEIQENKPSEAWFEVFPGVDLDDQIFNKLDKKTIRLIINRKIKVVGYYSLYAQHEKNMKNK